MREKRNRKTRSEIVNDGGVMEKIKGEEAKGYGRGGEGQ